MRKSRFSEEQIIHALKEHEAGTKTADICRRLGARRIRRDGHGISWGWGETYPGIAARNSAASAQASSTSLTFCSRPARVKGFCRKARPGPD